jgi:very-short-patch-repair endonuclease
MGDNRREPNNRRIRGTQPAIEQGARNLRQELTGPERILWNELRNHGLDGVGFRRQHPVGRLILDFYAPAHHLVVEVDGPTHEDAAERDAERTAILQSYGYTVLRLSNDDVVSNIDGALNRIRAAIKATSNRAHP